MPVDLKKIIFSNKEVQAALVTYCIRQKIKMPRTAISRVVVNWETELTSNLCFLAEEDGGEEQVLTFSNEKLAAALILYCHIMKDPLPRDAQKTLDPAEDGVSLSLRYSWGETVKKDHPGFSIPWMSNDSDITKMEEEEVIKSDASSSP